MKKVRIFTNSVSDLTPALAKEYNITLIPDAMVFNGTAYLNNIDINPQKFYSMLKTCSELPTSSQPNVFQYSEAFKAADDCDEILCISLTSLMSGCYNTANIAKDELKSEGFAPAIYVYDSLMVSHGLAMVAIRAALLAEQGLNSQEIMAELEIYRPSIGVYFAMPSLQNARKGGRIGAVTCFTADAIGIKPLLCFAEGTVKDVGLVRGFKNAKNAVLKRYIKEADYTKDVCVFHADAYSEALEMRDKILEVAPTANVRIDWVGPIIGIYTGEGALGVAFEKRK